MQMPPPRCFAAIAESERIARSVLPPGGQGTMNVTGREGNVWACEVIEKRSPKNRTNRIAFIISSSLRQSYRSHEPVQAGTTQAFAHPHDQVRGLRARRRP